MTRIEAIALLLMFLGALAMFFAEELACEADITPEVELVDPHNTEGP